MITIDGYSELIHIGRGGLGDVYRATRDSTGGTVAIKVLRDISDESVAWHRTRRELTALVSLAGHANVIQLLELLELPEGPALVMEFAPGGSIADLMSRRDEPLSVGEAVFVGRHTATALVAAHAQGIVHRDVKPQNLLIDAYGQVKLCDFGIAAIARTEEFRTRTDAISMRYASPEDLDDEIDVGPAADVYSLGATLLHLVRGAPPTLKERLAPWEPPVTDEPDLGALDRIVAACLHPAPAARPTAAQLVDDLERLSWSMDERNTTLAEGAATDLPAPGFDDAATGRGDGGAGPSVVDRAPPSAARPAVSPAAHPRQTVDDRPEEGRQVAETDDTVHRPGGGRLARPAPDSPPPRRRWGIIVAAIAGVLTVAVSGFWWAERDEPPPTAETRLDVAGRPGDLPAVTSAEWPIGPAGECLVQIADVDVLEVAPCDDPHDLQRVSVGELDAARFPPDAVFDETAVRAVVRDDCDAAFEVFVGVDPASSQFDAPFSAPSAATWSTGDRTYQCLLGVPDRRIVGDAGGSSR